MEGGEGVRRGCIRIKFPSPRRIMSRLFPSHSKKTAMAKTHVRDRHAEDVHGVAEHSNPPSRIVDSDLQRRELLFNIGLSCYMLHLITNGREEIHKIVELKKELEKFIECHNDETRRKRQEFAELKSDIEKLLKYHNNKEEEEEHRRKEREQSETSSYVVDGPDESSSTDNYYYSPQTMETSLPVGCEMDQLEAELEAEFEILGQNQESQRSKLNLKEVSDKRQDSEVLMLGHKCPITKEQELQQGVCPYELERRLHELMEKRQEEEIKELEIALKDAKQKLVIKENEVSWWKDSAYIVSERIQEPCRIATNSRSHRYSLSR
ncbi:unnamed protein product [Cochlearia groenlandica]